MSELSDSIVNKDFTCVELVGFCVRTDYSNESCGPPLKHGVETKHCSSNGQNIRVYVGYSGGTHSHRSGLSQGLLTIFNYSSSSSAISVRPDITVFVDSP